MPLVRIVRTHASPLQILTLLERAHTALVRGEMKEARRSVDSALDRLKSAKRSQDFVLDAVAQTEERQGMAIDLAAPSSP